MSKDTVIKAFKSIKETTKAEVSQIIGNVPDWATGRILQSCPAKWDYPKYRLNHVYDGYMMTCKFEIRGGSNGSVSFTSKFLLSEAFKKAEIAKKPIIAEFSTRSAGTDASLSVLEKVLASVLPTPSDNCLFISTSNVCRNPIIQADYGFMFELDPKSLNCISRHDPVKDFGLHALTPHPLTDLETGETYNVGVSVNTGSKWKIMKFPRGSNLRSLTDSLKMGKVLATIPARSKTHCSWLHSFAMTKTYLIWIDQPCHFSLKKAAMLLLKGVCPKETMEWYPEKKNRFYIFNKKTCKVVKIEILSNDAFYFTHILNSYEEKGHIIVDIFSMRNIQFINSQGIPNLRAGQVLKDPDCPQLVRYVIPLVGEDLGKYPENRNLVKLRTTATAIRAEDKLILKPEVMSEVKMDYPTFNKRMSGGGLRFIWTSGAFCPSVHHNKIIKFDFATRESICWHAEPHQYVGEPNFIPRPAGTEKDDGIIVLVVVNYSVTRDKVEKDFMIWLDAKDLKELGRAHFDTEIPIALHSIWQSM